MKLFRILAWAVLAVLGVLAVALALVFALFDGNRLKAEISQAVLERYQRTLVIEGQPQLSVWPDVGVVLGAVSLSERGSSQPFAAMQSARVSVALLPLLGRQVQVRELQVKGLKAAVIRRKDGSLSIDDLLKRGNGLPAEQTHAQQPQGLRIDMAGLALTDGQLSWRDERSGQQVRIDSVNLSTGRVQADTGAKTASIEHLSVRVAGRSATDGLSLSIDAPKLQLSADRFGGEAVKIGALLQGQGRSAKLQLSLGDLQGQAQALRIGALSGSVELSHPDMPRKPLQLPLKGSLDIDLGKGIATLVLDSRFDQSKIASRLEVRRFSPLALGFDLDVDQLNIDQYLPPKATQAAGGQSGTSGHGGQSGQSGHGGAAADPALDLSALKGAPEMQGRVRVGALQVSGLKVSELDARVALAAGQLTISPLSLKLYQGSAAGSLALNAHEQRLSVRQTFSDVSIEPLMRDLLKQDLLQGRGNVALDLQARGQTLSALKKNLAGNASVSLRDGALKGINLAQSLREVKARIGQGQSTQTAQAALKTDFSELAASFKIAGGVARNDDLLMKSPFLRLSGTGEIDLAAGQLNYLARVSAVASAQGQGGKEVADLKGLTLAVRASGPFEALKYQLDWGAMLQEAAKAQIEEKKREVKARAEEAVKDKARELLKGVLGR
jgi:AsmA protein